MISVTAGRFGHFVYYLITKVYKFLNFSSHKQGIYYVRIIFFCDFFAFISPLFKYSDIAKIVCLSDIGILIHVMLVYDFFNV